MHRSDELQGRTQKFALRIMKLSRVLWSHRDVRPLADQLLRSGTSVAANHRAACRARSSAEFISRLGVVIEEADETVFWLKLLADGEVFPRQRLALLTDEAEQLLRIFAAAKRTSQARVKNQKLEIRNQKSEKLP
jgi:four helix bundle protein